jgi:hypothetical protein
MHELERPVNRKELSDDELVIKIEGAVMQEILNRNPSVDLVTWVEQNSIKLREVIKDLSKNHNLRSYYYDEKIFPSLIETIIELMDKPQATSFAEAA